MAQMIRSDTERPYNWERTTKAKRAMRSFVAFAIGASAFLLFPPSARAQLCEPYTRCTDYARCFINNVAQPCAYGSGGASHGGIIFKHGTFLLEFTSDNTARVTYGKNGQFKTVGRHTIEGGYHVFRLGDGVTVKYPVSGGRYAGG